MAILKDLIVHGSSRFLNKIYASEIQTPLIEAEAGVFKKLKADDATVIGLLDVKGQMHTNSWSNSNIATIDGSFYITPTIGSASGTVTITASTLTFSGTNYAISSLYLEDGSYITWPQYSKVLVTGQILSNGEWIPLGTLLGQLSSTATAASISINNIKDNKNQTSNILATLVNEGTTSSSYRNLKVSLYQRASSSTAFYPLGIYMTATGTNGRTFLDIYGGIKALSNSNNYGGLAEPNVRIGNLQGLPNVGGQTPSGWGIYTDNGYFKGIIAADRGYIGTGSRYWVIANYEDDSNPNNSRSYIYSYNGTDNGTNSIISTVEGIYLGTDGIRNYKDSTHHVTIKDGVITALGVNLTGAITATSGEIGGASITNGVLYITDANISGTISGNHIDASSISIGNLSGASNYAQKDYVDDAVGDVLTVANTALNQSSWYATCSTPGGTTEKVATITPATTAFTLTEGATVNVKFDAKNTGAVGSITLNVNGTGAKNIKYINNNAISNIPGTDYIAAGRTYQFVYDGIYWVIQNLNYNTNTNTIGTLGATKLIAGTDVSNTSATTVYRYTLIMKKTAGDNPTWVSLVTSSSTATSKTRYTGGLYPDKIFYMSTNVSTSPYGYNTGASIGDAYAALGFNLNYSTNCGSTLVIGKPVYLVGEINSLDGLFYLDQTWWTQTEPTIEDGKTYIYLGNAYSTTNVYLVEKNPLMRYYRGAFRTEEQIAGMTATSYITYVDAANGIKIHNYNNIADYIQINSDAISMYRRDTQQPQVPIETLRIQSDNIRIGKIGIGKRNVFITDSAVQIRNNTTTLASYGDSIVLGNEDSLSQITLSQTGVVFTPKTIANSTESAGTFKYIVNESGHSYTLVEESASNQNTGTATADPLRLNNNTYYSNTESFSDVILAKVNNEFWVLGKTNETETSVVVQSIGTDSETWNYNSTPVTKTIITYVTMEETQETTVEQEDGSEEIENIIVQVNYQITRIESWEKWNVTSGTIPENYIYSGYIKKDSSDETNQDLYSINYQKKISTSQSSTGTTLNVNVATDITTSLSFRQMTDFYENKNLDYITTEPDFSILFGKDVWTNSPYSYILGGEKNVIKTNSTIPALYSTIVGGYQNGYFYNKHANTPSLEDTLYKMGIECFIGNGYGNSVQSNLSSIVGGQYNAIYDGESFSVIGGGYNNSIQTWYDDTIPGNTNFYNAPYQFLGGGKNNSSRSDYGVLVGGYNNINLGKYSVISGGASNKTVGQYSVITGGNNNTVLGENSYAHGYLNIAEGNNQTVLGKANIPDSTSLLIVGNGTSNSNRSNALTLNQNGNLTIAMDLNLHSPHSILLAQKSDYSINPSNLMKANRIYANQYAGSMNNYYISQGYHSYYANGNWILSLESAKINSAVPLQAPNNVQWIDNTNNISRANVIYYGSPSTSDHPTATANQPANGWYYYRQLAASGGYNILLGIGMNSNNPTLRIRSRYKDVSTNTYKWTNWIDFSKVGHTHSNYALSSHTHPISDITSSTTTLTITRSISTTYMTATSFARLAAKKKDRMLYFYFNAWFDGSNYSVSDFTTIATISSWNAINDAVISVPCQNDGTKILTVMVTSTGAIRVYSTKAISGWYRTSICVPSSS